MCLTLATCTWYPSNFLPTMMEKVIETSSVLQRFRHQHTWWKMNSPMISRQVDSLHKVVITYSRHSQRVWVPRVVSFMCRLFQWVKVITLLNNKPLHYGVENLVSIMFLLSHLSLTHWTLLSLNIVHYVPLNWQLGHVWVCFTRHENIFVLFLICEGCYQGSHVRDPVTC